MTIHTRTKGNYQPLLDQLNKLVKHNRQGSLQTKRRYYEAMKRFCYFLADEYHLQKLANISGKHLTAYVLRMQEDSKSPSTIKTDLAYRLLQENPDIAKLIIATLQKQGS